MCVVGGGGQGCVIYEVFMIKSNLNLQNKKQIILLAETLTHFLKFAYLKSEGIKTDKYVPGSI